MITPQSQSARLVEIGDGRFAHASGALWLPDLRTAVIADAHLGYGWAQRRRGQLGPTNDAGLREKIDGVIEDLAPETVVFLGDLVHAPRPAAPEREYICGVLAELREKAAIVAVRGNHDRGFERDFADLKIILVPAWQAENLVAIHGDRIPAEVEGHLVVGHIHPALTVIDHAGAGRRIPIFACAPRGTLLPAFSPFAAGFDIRAGLPADLRPFLPAQSICVVAATGRRAVQLGSLRRLRSA